MKTIATKMSFLAVEMDKEFAQKLLDRNHPNNRRVKQTRVLTYREDMDSGRWDLTWEPVVEDEDNYLVEGQHRLSAFLQSNLETFPCIFCTHAPRKAIMGAGSALSRTVADVARISGDPLPHGEIGFGSVARRMYLGLRANVGVSNKSLLAFVNKHYKALNFAYDESTLAGEMKRGLTKSGIRAVVARSYYGNPETHARIGEFCKSLLSGLINNAREDVAVIRLRNWLLEFSHPVRGEAKGTRPNDIMIYAKTEQALISFLNKEYIDKLYGTKEELFPIPE